MNRCQQMSVNFILRRDCGANHDSIARPRIATDWVFPRLRSADLTNGDLR